jgi:hypothetical protein
MCNGWGCKIKEPGDETGLSLDGLQTARLVVITPRSNPELDAGATALLEPVLSPLKSLTSPLKSLFSKTAAIGDPAACLAAVAIAAYVAAHASYRCHQARLMGTHTCGGKSGGLRRHKRDGRK